jgi:hypothetical protein
LKPFERRLLQQDQSVADIVAVGIGMGGENFSDAHCQATRPATGFSGINWLNASFHSGNEF